MMGTYTPEFMAVAVKACNMTEQAVLATTYHNVLSLVPRT